uniref:Uncharacterized protein n=1 Tax=Magallana gigas TaxID=29159 RepID=A0A8W8J0Q5_MAGGI
MDKKEKIIISPEAERHHKPKINKPLIAVLILGKPTKDRREHLKYGNRIHLESEHNDKMTLFQLVPYIRVLFLSICWGTVGGAYFPNFGFVGCYLYDGYMKMFSNFILTEVNVSNGSNPELILCFKECMNNHTYAGLKPTPNDDNYYQCFCGDDYNQTFAVDKAMCTHKNHTLMKIYNTDYDIKPLLSVPGNQTNIFEIWNATKRYKALFVNDVMRNPAIDWWKDKRLYHTPEYVKVSAMNKHGQELWAIEFFTNESSAELIDWLNPENAFNRTISNSTNIFVDKGQIVIQSKDESTNKYYFVHGPIRRNDSRVTVVTRDGTPQSGCSGVGRVREIIVFASMRTYYPITTDTLPQSAHDDVAIYNSKASE